MRRFQVLTRLTKASKSCFRAVSMENMEAQLTQCEIIFEVFGNFHGHMVGVILLVKKYKFLQDQSTKTNEFAYG